MVIVRCYYNIIYHIVEGHLKYGLSNILDALFIFSVRSLDLEEDVRFLQKDVFLSLIHLGELMNSS